MAEGKATTPASVSKADEQLRYAVYWPSVQNKHSELREIYVIGIDPGLGEFKSIRSRCVAFKTQTASRVGKRHFSQRRDEAVEIRDKLVAQRGGKPSDGANPVEVKVSHFPQKVMWLEAGACFAS